MNSDERIAVLEAKLERNETDITKLFDFLRDHMEKEEHDRAEFLKMLAEIDTVIKKQKSFLGGVVFAISSVWAIVTGILYWVFKMKGT